MTDRMLCKFGLRCLEAYIKGNLMYSHSFVLSSPGKLRWRPGKITPPSTVAKRWQVWWLDLRSLEACINGNLKYGHLWVIIITWKIKVNDLEKLLHPAQWLNGDSYADWICSVLKSAGDGRLWVTIIRWKIMVSDLEKLLHRAVWPNGDRYDDSVCGVSTVAIITWKCAD